MEIKPQKHPTLIKAFWPRVRKGAIYIVIFFQLLALAASASLLYGSGFLQSAPLACIGILSVQAIIGAAVSVVLYLYIARPTKNILSALIHVAGEPTTITPPNPNDPQFESTGLKPVLETIYHMASGVKGSHDTKTVITKGHSLIENALNDALCGFVIFNNKRDITYANKATPLSIDAEGHRALSLLFNDTNTLEQWWNECEESAVHAEKTWPRIPNKLPNEEDRRFFDVIASYNKGAEHEMILTLIDRTYLYKVSEEELDFIAFAAHELRGPITVIRGYLDVLQSELEGMLEDDQKELFSRLTVSANRLSGYINNILNTSKYDRRHLRVRLVENSFATIFSTIQDDMQLRASAQNRVLNVSIPTDLPTIAADSASLSEVMSNLIDNAIKYSNEGGVITVSATSKGDSVELSVEDRGIGMPGSVVSNLFQKFYRSHRSRETVAGTGIGLYISKAIVESHGGTISVRSEDGHGSTFTISLPTFAMVADKLKEADNKNETLMNNDGSWIKNHTMFRG